MNNKSKKDSKPTPHKRKPRTKKDSKIETTWTEWDKFQIQEGHPVASRTTLTTSDGKRWVLREPRIPSKVDAPKACSILQWHEAGAHQNAINAKILRNMRKAYPTMSTRPFFIGTGVDLPPIYPRPYIIPTPLYLEKPTQRPSWGRRFLQKLKKFILTYRFHPIKV